MISDLALGVVLGAALILYARALGPRGEAWALAVGLVVAALIYVGFGLAGGAASRWLVLEASGLPLFGLFAWLGVRRSVVWLAVGWAAHVAWDLGFHLGPVAQAFVPQWYPVICTSCDLLIAGYLAARGRTQVDGREAA